MGCVWDNLWKLKVPTKVKHLHWGALNDMIPSKFNLQKRGVDTIIDCPICFSHIESTDHSLFGCKRAKEIWRISGVRVFLEENFNDSLVDRWMKINRVASKKDLEIIATTC